MGGGSKLLICAKSTEWWCREGQAGLKVVLGSGKVGQQRGIQAKQVERRRMAKMAPIMGWLQRAVGSRGQARDNGCKEGDAL